VSEIEKVFLRDDAGKWHGRFLDLATLVGSWSKDPSMKVGAVIVAPDRSVLGTGYNGFPRGVVDRKEWLDHRPTKYMTIVHAELNAILAANAVLRGSEATLYCSAGFPCPDCMKHIIQAGIRRVVFPPQFVRSVDTAQAIDWDERSAHSAAMAEDAGVTLVRVADYPTKG
jgi:dCMP deaminase